MAAQSECSLREGMQQLASKKVQSYIQVCGFGFYSHV